MSTPHLSLCTILSESKRIIKAHSRHFLALSVLFLLPLSFSIVVFPTLQQLLLHLTTNDSRTLLSHAFYRSITPTPKFDKQSLLLTLFFSVFTFVLSLCAAGSITYSIFHGFYGRPVKFILDLVSRFGGISNGWSWAFVLQIVIASTLLMLLFLYNIAANTVLYMYCKAIHGELAMEIAEEFSKEYVSLPFDNGKVPHLVSVAYNGY
ncbi:hypothetical protein Pint_23569 [Pistacia integerrima]|uniref:Uncharacterized protein n=1 Tax=Pistacia integerrima TaxID=434235 RepID=A0ACC0YIC2_9ROSI|nr:hypothetical protein Pint_23569 [Pistacia integerrima]